MDWYANSDSWNMFLQSHLFVFPLLQRNPNLCKYNSRIFYYAKLFWTQQSFFLQFSDTEKLATEHLLPKKEVCGECSLIVRVFNLPYKEYLNSLLEKCLLHSISTYFILFQVSSSWLSKTVLKCQKPLFPILREYLILHSLKYSWGSI